MDNFISRFGGGLMIAAAMALHELVGLDAEGMLCACGTKSVDHLEHLGEVALQLLDAPPVKSKRRTGSTTQKVSPVGWEAMQVRERNLASFRQMTEVWPEPKRRRGPRYRFEPWQLQVADRVIAGEEQAA